MIFKKWGNEKGKVIILLHGGGLSWWSYKDIIALLEEEYQIITPIIDGYGESYKEDFISIEESAKNLISYIEDNFSGKVFAMAGLSIGAQILVEVASRKGDICEYLIIESALVSPLKGVGFLKLMTNISYPLIKKPWFAKLQAKELMLPKESFEMYYEDSIKISRKSLENTIISNSTYSLKEGISLTKAKTLIIVGEKEINSMIKSANILNEAIKNSTLYVAKGMKHGQLSLLNSKQYVKIIKDFFNE